MDQPEPPPEPETPEPSEWPAASLQLRAGLVSALVVGCFLGYFVLGLTQDPLEAGELRLGIDDAIPLIPATMYCYVWVYTVMLYPAFVIRERRLFVRTTLAYTVVVVISLSFYALMPVTSIHIRPDVSQLDMSVFHNWGLRVNYALDPPMNLFPSLHLSIATLAALCAWRARPLWGYLAIPLVLGIAVSIVTVKQHFVVDGVAGLVLGGGCYWAFVHATPRGPRPAYDWRGPVAYSGVLLGFYAGFFAAFLLGYAPWA